MARRIRRIDVDPDKRYNEHPNESTERTRHQWQALALGRICSVCKLIQVDGEFDDAPTCDVREVG